MDKQISMEDKKYYLKKQVDELEKWGSEIDELKAMVGKAKSESKRELLSQSIDLGQKLETARHNLIQVFISIRNQGYSE